ncbi:MAG: hypothetical protein IJ811_00555, partial [Clostridia bacterium]|nr:hypothetical protein [Clostridia bacterium]
MKNSKILKLSALTLSMALSIAMAVGCAENGNGAASDNGSGVGGGGNAVPTAQNQVLNGGFETATLEGWTIEYGDAF